MSSVTRDRGLSTARAVLCVLSYIAENPRGVSAQEIARYLDKSRSTAYHLLASLEAEGFIARVGRAGRYRLIVDKPGAPAPAPEEPAPLMPDAERLLEDGMREVFKRTGRRTCIGMFSVDGVALVRDIGRQGLPRMGNLEKPLIRHTAHALSIGKLLLAGLDAASLEHWVERHGLRSFTPRTIADPGRLRDELALVRERGVATDRCEYDVGFGSLAAPVCNPDGRPVAALGVSMTRAQFATEREHVERALLTVTRELGAGGRRPAPGRAPA